MVSTWLSLYFVKTIAQKLNVTYKSLVVKKGGYILFGCLGVVTDLLGKKEFVGTVNSSCL